MRNYILQRDGTATYTSEREKEESGESLLCASIAFGAFLVIVFFFCLLAA